MAGHHDQLATGKKIRVLTVVDTFSRYVPVLDPRFSYRTEDVVRTLEQVSTAPFLAADLVRLGIVVAFPALALWLPSVLNL